MGEEEKVSWPFLVEFAGRERERAFQKGAHSNEKKGEGAVRLCDPSERNTDSWSSCLSTFEQKLWRGEERRLRSTF